MHTYTYTSVLGDLLNLAYTFLKMGVLCNNNSVKETKRYKMPLNI